MYHIQFIHVTVQFVHIRTTTPDSSLTTDGKCREWHECFAIEEVLFGADTETVVLERWGL